MARRSTATRTARPPSPSAELSGPSAAATTQARHYDLGGTTTVPAAVTATIGSASTAAADGPRSGCARHTTRASNAIWRLRVPTRVITADTSSTSPAITGA